MASIAVSWNEFVTLRDELGAGLVSCSAEEAQAGLRCLALAAIGLVGTDEERQCATAEVRRMEHLAASGGRDLGGRDGTGDALLLAMGHECRAGCCPPAGAEPDRLLAITRVSQLEIEAGGQIVGG